MSSPKTKVSKEIMIDSLIEYDLEHMTIEGLKEAAGRALEPDYWELPLEEIQDFYREVIEDMKNE